PDGSRLLVGLDGRPGLGPAGVAIIDLGRVDRRACRTGASGCRVHPTIRIADFKAWDKRMAELKAAGVRVLSKRSPVSQDLSVTTLAVTPDSRTAWVNLQENNAVAILDLDAAEIRQVYGLPYKDHSLPGNGLDASDKDGTIAIRPWPIRALYQPDGLAAFETMGKLFFATANEGDPRHFEDHDESARVMDLTLDPAHFPDAGILRRENHLGRLHVSRLMGDTDDDGDYDELYAFGGRSFSIWTPDAKLVFDSGDDMEQIIARALPDDFNVSESANDFDARSDSRGPEPEHLAAGEIGSQVYVFIAFERIGGVMVYHVTDPRRPRFEQYINNRNFAIDPREVCGDKGQKQIPSCARAGDLEPEGLLFIAAGDSPFGVPMLVVIHELSDSTTLYRIDRLRQ
ncbi:MAG: choice-of-anchor I family protein, partial [Gammaproteobacteria bacterium]